MKPGSTLGPYEILAPIGSGGMGGIAEAKRPFQPFPALDLSRQNGRSAGSLASALLLQGVEVLASIRAGAA